MNDFYNNEDAGDCAQMNAADASECDDNCICKECEHSFNSEWADPECPECGSFEITLV